MATAIMVVAMTVAVAAAVGSFAAGSHFLFLPFGGFRIRGRRSCRTDAAGVKERVVKDRRKGRRFEELMGSEDFGHAWMDYLKVFFADWELSTDEVLALLENSARMARKTFVNKPD